MDLRGLKVRMATDEHGPAIGQLAKDHGFQWDDWDCDWTHIGTSWLVALDHDRVIGCLQVLPALPFGRLEFLCVGKEISRLKRAWVLNALWKCGEHLLKRSGCQAFKCLIVDADGTGWRAAVEKRGFIPLARGVIMMKVIAEDTAQQVHEAGLGLENG